MPVYDFRCRECGKVTEILLRSESGKAICCTDCGSHDLERLMSASVSIKTGASEPGTTCCGRTERCESPPCSGDDGCCRR
jgi:putative FmdB family regulatory protein